MSDLCNRVRVVMALTGVVGRASGGRESDIGSRGSRWLHDDLCRPCRTARESRRSQEDR